MKLTQQQYACITAAIQRIRCLMMQAQGTIEDHAGILQDLNQPWTIKIAKEMHGQLETLSLIEQKARMEWLPFIEEHKP